MVYSRKPSMSCLEHQHISYHAFFQCYLSSVQQKQKHISIISSFSMAWLDDRLFSCLFHVFHAFQCFLRFFYGFSMCFPMVFHGFPRFSMDCSYVFLIFLWFFHGFSYNFRFSSSFSHVFSPKFAPSKHGEPPVSPPVQGTEVMPPPLPEIT